MSNQVVIMQTSKYIDIWQKIFKDYSPVQSYVVFAHGSVVIFKESHKNEEEIRNQALELMDKIEPPNSLNDVSVMKVKGK